MTRHRLNSKIRIAVIAVTLFFACTASSRTAAPDEEICDVNADFVLGLEDYPASMTLHRKVVRAHNEYALAHYHLGFAYGMTGHATEEISEYLEAAKLRLRKWDLFLNLGVAHLDQNETPRAIDALRTAVLLRPKQPAAHFDLAIAYARSNRLPEALEEMTASLQLEPKDFDKGATAVDLARLAPAKSSASGESPAKSDDRPHAANRATGVSCRKRPER